jgi:hypothetical protein
MPKAEKSEKIFCANCRHCVVVKVTVPNKPGAYLLRLKCTQGVWQKKLGNEKLHKYFTAARRIMEECEHFDSMGDLDVFIKDLRKMLPAQDEFYKEGVGAMKGRGEARLDDDEDDE